MYDKFFASLSFSCVTNLVISLSGKIPLSSIKIALNLTLVLLNCEEDEEYVFQDLKIYSALFVLWI